MTLYGSRLLLFLLATLTLMSWSHSFYARGTTDRPTFSQPSYKISINETDVQPIFILNVPCNDTNGQQLSYSLLAEEDTPFSINSTSGDITTTSILDYETVTSYTFTCICAVNGSLDLNDTTSVTVNILPVNEELPVILMNVIHVIVDCTTPVGLLHFLLPGVAYNITDSDRPEKYYYFNTGNSYANFSFNESTGGLTMLTPISPLVRLQQYVFHITICDRLPRDNSCPNVVIHIAQISVNRHDPVFESSNYSTTVQENTPINTTLLKVKCTDEDQCNGVYGGMEILDSDDKFSIDSDGNIANLQPFDYEDAQVHSLRIRCYDESIFVKDPQRETFATVNIVVMDVNDNPPICPSPNLTATLQGGTQQNQHHVVTLSCEDKDDGTNGQLMYTIQKQAPGTEAGQFSLDPATGLLSFTGKVPSVSSSFTINVLVSDLGDPQLTTKVQVTVHVTEVASGLTRVRSFPTLAIAIVCIVGGLLLCLLCCIILIACIYSRTKCCKGRKHYFITSPRSDLPKPKICNITTPVASNNEVREVRLYLGRDSITPSSDEEGVDEVCVFMGDDSSSASSANFDNTGSGRSDASSQTENYVISQASVRIDNTRNMVSTIVVQVQEEQQQNERPDTLGEEFSADIEKEALA